MSDLEGDGGGSSRSSSPGSSSSAAIQSAVAKAADEVADMPEGRMGCQAAVVKLPRWKNGGSELEGHRHCVLVVGGELCEDERRRSAHAAAAAPRIRQLSSVAAYDLDAGRWCETEAVPAMAMPRTTMALCLGMGRVAP